MDGCVRKNRRGSCDAGGRRQGNPMSPPPKRCRYPSLGGWLQPTLRERQRQRPQSHTNGTASFWLPGNFTAVCAPAELVLWEIDPPPWSSPSRPDVLRSFCPPGKLVSPCVLVDLVAWEVAPPLPPMSYGGASQPPTHPPPLSLLTPSIASPSGSEPL